MSLQILRAASEAESSDDLHLSRLLILLRAAGGRKNVKTVEGITKLAKLDFLLRYPTCLERALQAVQNKPERAQVKEHERFSIESKMIRFRYGPWDGRYRRWIALLVARGLAETYVRGNTVHVHLTQQGAEVADKMRQIPDFSDIDERSQVITSVFGGLSSMRIKEFVYTTFPELLSMKWGEDIDL